MALFIRKVIATIVCGRLAVDNSAESLASIQSGSACKVKKYKQALPHAPGGRVGWEGGKHDLHNQRWGNPASYGMHFIDCMSAAPNSLQWRLGCLGRWNQRIASGVNCRCWCRMKIRSPSCELPGQGHAQSQIRQQTRGKRQRGKGGGKDDEDRVSKGRW